MAAALANDRGFYSAVGAIDADKVEILELALDLLDADAPDRALVLATLCSELAHGSPLERRQALADEALAIAESSGDDAIVVRVLNHLYVPLQVPALLELSLARTAEALARAERIGDPACSSGRRFGAAKSPPAPGTSRRWTAASRSTASTGRRCSNQPIFNWGHTFFLGLRAQIAGDTDRAEQLATEALRIGTDSGQLDAAVIFGAQFMIVSGQRGTMSDLVPLIEQMAAETPDISRRFFGSLLAKAHVEGGRIDEARQLLEEFAARLRSSPRPALAHRHGRLRRGGHRMPGPCVRRAAFDRLEPWAGQLPATGASASARSATTSAASPPSSAGTTSRRLLRPGCRDQ